MDEKKASYNEEDTTILENMKNVVKGIAETFGRECEVVLHSLKDLNHSIIAIENNTVTGREVGGPMTDFALSLLKKAGSLKSDVVGSYYSYTNAGKRLKSTTILLRNSSLKPIGLLCINLNISAPLDSFMKSLIISGEENLDNKIEEHFPLTANDLIEVSLKKVLSIVGSKRELSPTEKNKTIIAELYKRGIFQVKNGVDIVASALGISRYTVYNYLRETKMNEEKVSEK